MPFLFCVAVRGWVSSWVSVQELVGLCKSWWGVRLKARVARGWVWRGPERCRWRWCRDNVKKGGKCAMIDFKL